MKQWRPFANDSEVPTKASNEIEWISTQFDISLVKDNEQIAKRNLFQCVFTSLHSFGIGNKNQFFKLNNFIIKKVSLLKKREALFQEKKTGLRNL